MTVVFNVGSALIPEWKNAPFAVMSLVIVSHRSCVIREALMDKTELTIGSVPDYSKLIFAVGKFQCLFDE